MHTIIITCLVIDQIKHIFFFIAATGITNVHELENELMFTTDLVFLGNTMITLCTKLFCCYQFTHTVVPVMNGHPRDQAKVSVHCRWPLIRGNLTLKCVSQGIDNMAVQGRWPLTTGVAQGRYYCITFQDNILYQ